jgi:hypothetical protein
MVTLILSKGDIIALLRAYARHACAAAAHALLNDTA